LGFLTSLSSARNFYAFMLPTVAENLV